MSELVFQHKTGYILFERKVVTTLSCWRQNGRKYEAGGILIGYRRPPHIQVVACTTPYKYDRRSRFGFVRRDQRHTQIAHKFWNKSNGKAYYLGEWHTHPVNKPAPSSIDCHEWRKLINSRLGTSLLFVIVGREQWYVQYNNKSLNLSADIASGIFY